MANNSANVTTGKPKPGGAIWVAPVGTTLPTSVGATLDPAFKCLGYASEDGVTNDNSPSSEQIKAWGGATVLSIQTERPDSFGVTLIEAKNVEVLKVVYGASNVTVSASGAITVKSTADELPNLSWVFDLVNSDGSYKRIVIPRGRVSETGTITYADNAAVGYELTITDTPDTAGAYHYEYIEAPTTYTVTFNTNGGSAVAAQIVTAGSPAVQPDNPTKDGYVFSGWFADEELTTVYQFGTPVNANTTVYAQWDAE